MLSTTFILLFAALAVCIEAGLVILRTPSPELAEGETETLQRLPSAF